MDGTVETKSTGPHSQEASVRDLGVAEREGGGSAATYLEGSESDWSGSWGTESKEPMSHRPRNI